jgi:hypothetical protein
MAGALGSRKGPSVLVVDLSINRDPPPHTPAMVGEKAWLPVPW